MFRAQVRVRVRVHVLRAKGGKKICSCDLPFLLPLLTQLQTMSHQPTAKQLGVWRGDKERPVALTGMATHILKLALVAPNLWLLEL